MAKSKRRRATGQLQLVSQPTDTTHQHRCGEIKQSYEKAILADPLFRQRVEQKRKGKGSYQRRAKYGKGWEPSLKQAA